MQTIKESLQANSDILLESVIDKHIQMLINQLVKFHNKPKDVFDKLKINADKVDPSRIRVYKYIDKDALKAIEKAMDENYNYIFGIKNGLVCFIYNTTIDSRNDDNYVWLPTKEGHVFGAWDATRENPLWNYKENSKSTSRRVKIFEHCNEVWVLNYSKSLQRALTIRDRNNAKYGMWENTPEFYAKVLKDNLERYKTKGALMRMQKGSEFESVMKDVNKFINSVTELLLDMHKNMTPDQWGYQYQCKELMMDLNRHSTRILDYVGYVLRSQRDYEDSKKNGYNEDYYIRQYREYIQDVKDLLKEGKEKYDLLIETIDKFKKENS